MTFRTAIFNAAVARPAFHTQRFSTLNRLHKDYESSVQTPFQSQNKDSVVPRAARPEAEAMTSETPLQKQRREALAPQAGQARHQKTWVLPGLLAGMITIPPLVYYYYQYRREHMDNKRASLLEQQRQKQLSAAVAGLERTDRSRAPFLRYSTAASLLRPTEQGGKVAVRRENCPKKVDGKCGNSWFDDQWSEGGYGGKRYIVYKHQSANRTPSTPIELQEVKDDGVTLVGKPIKLLDWQEGDFGSIEAPSIYKTPAGKYMLTYSKGNTVTTKYTASYAVADNIKGPYVRKGDLLKTGDFGLNAPGGGEITWNGERMLFHEMQQPIGKPYEGVRKMHAANIEADDRTGKVTFEAL